MTGTWTWQENPPQQRVLLQSTQGSLSFCDQRMFGSLGIIPETEIGHYIDRIGHDLLQSPMDEKEWLAIQKTKLGNWEIGPALLTQDRFSGIGNIYKAEILYKLGINPQRPIKDLPDAVWQAVNETAYQIMSESYRLGGSSVQSYSADGIEGTYQNYLLIYRKEVCPLGHTVEQLPQRGRTTWWCPQCQA